MSSVNILVGIPCYGAGELDLVLESLSWQTAEEFEVQVHVDGDQEYREIFDTIMKWSGKLANPIRWSANPYKGLGSSYRQIGQFAYTESFDYCFLLDNDAFLPKEFMYHMKSFIKANPWVGYAGWKSLKPDRAAPVSEISALPTPLIKISESATQLCGCGLLFRTDLYKYWNTEYKVYYQDSDFCCSAAMNGEYGYRLWFPMFWHREHGTIAANNSLEACKEMDHQTFLRIWGREPEETEKRYLKNLESRKGELIL